MLFRLGACPRLGKRASLGAMAGGPSATAAAPGGYRPEIDGLRAIAVAGVIWFHTGLAGLPGGFVGVDVFLVISGYLITGRILRGLDAGSFSFAAFYLARVRRILPALLVACGLSLPFAYWLMLPDYLENYGQSLLATVLSANNLLLYLTADYFGLETAFKPLAHAWSLAVEEQYYLLVPLLLVLAVRLRGRAAVGPVLLVLSLASLALAEMQRTADPMASFYLLPARFWELGLGGLAMLAEPHLRRVTSPQMQPVLAWVGLAALLGAFATFTAADNLPGLPSLVPTLGTALLMVFGSAAGPGQLLTLAPLRWLGLISYSAYLYHHLVFANLRLASLSEPSPTLLAASVPGVLLLAWLSWRYVEQPCRDPQRWPPRRLLSAVVAGSAALALTGLALHATSGLKVRWAELADGGALIGTGQNAAYVDGPFRYSGQPLAPANRPRNVLVLGNSFARDVINMGDATGAWSGWTLAYDSFTPCLGQPLPDPVLAQVRAAGAVVIGSGAGAATAPCLAGLIDRLKRLGVSHVVVIGPKQFGYNNNAVMRLPAAQRYVWRATPQSGLAAQSAAARAALPAGSYVDLLALMDDGSETVPVFTPQRKLISQDHRHLTPAGAQWLGGIVFAQPQLAFLKEPR